MYVIHDRHDDTVIQLEPDELEALSRALAEPAPASPAFSQAMAELQASAVTSTTIDPVIDWQPTVDRFRLTGFSNETLHPRPRPCTRR